MNQAAAHITIQGLVQGVGYRYYCFRHATNLKLTGWVKNEANGTVHVHAEGDKGGLEAFIDHLRVGPANAVVRNVQVQWEPFTGKYTSFSISH